MIPILDNGHGGVIAGKYVTPGKRSPDWDLGVLYEGAFNRWIINGVMEELDQIGFPYYHVSPEIYDVSLPTRVRRANQIFDRDSDTYLLSIHANAGRGTGMEGYTSIGDSQADPICDIFLRDLQIWFPDSTMRYDFIDGDRDKESKFYILTQTKCPAILLELGFMDHLNDYRKLWSVEWRSRMIQTLSNTIIELCTHKNFVR